MSKSDVYRAGMDKSEIDAITAEFFGAFDNRGGKAPDVARIRRLMLPGGVIAVTSPRYLTYTVEEFIEPREALLTDGRLTEFAEWETSETTLIDGDIACRIGTYAKSGTMSGEPYAGEGSKTFQFVRTPEGWRIAAFSWYDRP